jgi:hypothetical protein
MRLRGAVPVKAPADRQSKSLSADTIALVSLLVSLAALVVSVFAIVRANNTTSAATIVSLNEAFRQAWERYFNPKTPDQKSWELAELMNLLEIACAVYLEWSLSGNARKLIFDYLQRNLSDLIEHKEISAEIGKLLQDKETFLFIKKFLHKNEARLKATIPLGWYQLSE